MKVCCSTSMLILALSLLPSWSAAFGAPKSLGNPEYKTSHGAPKTQFDYRVEGPPPTDMYVDPTAFPRNLPTQTIQGGDTRLTYKMPPGADRVQMLLKTNGRPLKARVELWCGPIRRTHFCDIDLMDGMQTQFRACLKFKNVDSAGPQTLQINTKSADAFPAQAGIDVFTPQRSDERMEEYERIWDAGTKIFSQGDGSVRSIPIDDKVKAVQMLVWAKDVGKKSFKANIEFLQGPNNKRQYYEMQCGGGSQPYHAVFETPGSGWTFRLTNKKTIHDGAFEFVLLPYETEGEGYGGAYATEGIEPTPVNNQLGGFDGHSSTHQQTYGTSLGPHGNDKPKFGSGDYGGYGSGAGSW